MPLKQEVDRIINANKKDAWFYHGRIKELVSFALKLETGRFEDPSSLEDFFACSLVVENSKAIKDALNLINTYFVVQYRRPDSDNFTHKDSYSFLFDDLRLYAYLRENPALPPRNYSSIIFEIQIKTFLQHAWSIATHDLIYKADTVDWGKERIAYQIKAMLEHAEISILEVDSLSKCLELDKINKETDSLTKIISYVKYNWEEIDLPKDIVRLSRNIKALYQALNMSFDELILVVDEETKLGRGARTKNLSPYLAIVQSIYNQSPDKLRKFVNGKRKDYNILLPEELEIPDDFANEKSNNAIKLKPEA